MKVLVDCVPLSVGGGVQVAIGVVTAFARQSAVNWTAVAPRYLRPALPETLAADPRILFVNRRCQADRVWLSRRLHWIERAVAPDVVFTVFGPPFFRARAPHLVGFAIPHLIYDRHAKMPRGNLIDKMGDAARRMLFRRADHIVEPRRDLIEKMGDPARCMLFRRADHIVVETETARRRLADRLSIDRARISVIPNSPNPLLERLPEQPAWAEERFNILIPSAYYWHKNLGIVPQVAAAMRQLSPDLDFQFRFTLPADGAPWQRISKSAAALGVADRLITLGVVRIEALSRAYHEATAVYLPTLREISTAVYPESFFFRRPLVTSDLDFARELCGEAALFVPPLDPQATAARLIELAVSPALSARLVAGGERQLVSAYPTPEEKFRLQLDLIAKVSSGQMLNVRSSGTGTGKAAAAGSRAIGFRDFV
jgi:glycosyltransferase involved in cell wall biosynthesis